MARIFATFRPPGRPAARPAPPPQYPYEPPISLFASVSVTSGSETGLRARALSNLTGKPVSIHEIRVLTETTLYGQPVNAGAFVEISLDLDGKPITNGFVPVWLLGRVTSPTSEQSSGQTAGVSVGRVHSAATWRLPQPFVMRPGATVNATLRHRGMVTAPITVDTALVGKQVAHSPAGLQRLPFITAFLGTPTDYNVALTEESPEQALLNTLRTPLHVSRIIGRIVTYASRPVGTLVSSWWNDDFYNRMMRVRLNLSTGRAFVRDLTPFGAIFSRASGNTWETDFLLNPSEYLLATFDKQARADAPPASFADTYKIQPQIAISGWREE